MVDLIKAIGPERPGPPLPMAVVIPTRHVNSAVCAHAARVDAMLRPMELVLVQPDDADPPSACTPAPAHWRVLGAPRGRGTQCNAGARATTAPLLLFLHDDTLLPEAAARCLAAAFADADLGMACFRLRFDHRHPLLALYGWWTRFDSRWTTFGDQAYVLRRTLFDAVGGFPDWPLFEDVELARRVRRHRRPLGRIRKLPASVTTSATRYVRGGVLRQQMRNLWAMLRFFAGASPWQLAAAYERAGTRQQRPTMTGPPRTERADSQDRALSQSQVQDFP
jgi:hypothetical protein